MGWDVTILFSLVPPTLPLLACRVAPVISRDCSGRGWGTSLFSPHPLAPVNGDCLLYTEEMRGTPVQLVLKGFLGLPRWGLICRDHGSPLHWALVLVSWCLAREMGVLWLLGTPCSWPPSSSFLSASPSSTASLPLSLHSPFLPASSGFLSNAFRSSLEVKCILAYALKVWSPCGIQRWALGRWLDRGRGGGGFDLGNRFIIHSRLSWWTDLSEVMGTRGAP